MAHFDPFDLPFDVAEGNYEVRVALRLEVESRAGAQPSIDTVVREVQEFIRDRLAYNKLGTPDGRSLVCVKSDLRVWRP